MLGEHGEEGLDGLLGAVVDSESQEVPDVVLGEVGWPAGAFGVGGDEPIDAGLVFEHGALEDVGGGDEVGFGLLVVWIIEVGGFAHPGGVDEGEVGEGVPGLSEVYLVGVADGGGGGGDDFVSDHEEGLGLGVVLGVVWWEVFAGVVGDEVWGDVVDGFEDEFAEGDGGVGVGVGVDGGDLIDGDGGEEADGEGWAVASDHSGGDEGEGGGRGLGSGEVDDGGESDVGFSGLDHCGDFGGDGPEEGGVFEGFEALDEGGGVEVGDGGDVHWSGSDLLWWGCVWVGRWVVLGDYWVLWANGGGESLVWV